MTFAHRIQRRRFELKYIVDERLAQAIRDFASAYLTPDKHGKRSQNYAYPICSLYLDSPQLTLYRATVDGHRSRFKLRIRFYDDSPQTPAYFEIKRRVDAVILKERAAVRRTSILRLLDGHWPKRSDLADDDADSYDALQRFCDLRHSVRADGQVFVSYTREAYVPPNDNSVRLNFDRELSVSNYQRALAPNNSRRGFHPRLGGVILELKFTDRFPTWMRDMVGIFNLERRRVPKYVTCVRSLRTRQFPSMPANQEVQV